MSGKKKEQLEKNFIGQGKDIQRIDEKVEKLDGRLIKIEEELKDSLKSKKKIILSILLDISLLAVAFSVGRFVQKADTYINNVKELDDRVTQLQLANDIVCVQLPQNVALMLNTEKKTGNKELAPLTWSKDTIVDEKGDITAEDLVGKQMVATYEVDGIHTVFYGSYNKLYHWQGSCLLNSYNEDNQLVFVMEALYEDGELLSYKQLSAEEGEEPYWLVSKRIVSEEGNQGESWTYYKDRDIKQNFDWNLVTQKKMLTMDDVSDKLEFSLRSYYKGMTADGKYNDNTGNAILISFARDEQVDTFYQGQFVDGLMEDQTGNAWEIARNAENGVPYMYQQGIFAKGKCTETTVPVHTELSMDEILEYLNSHGIENTWQWASH